MTLHYRKVKSDINVFTYAVTAGWWFVDVTYRTCDRLSTHKKEDFLMFCEETNSNNGVVLFSTSTNLRT